MQDVWSAPSELDVATQERLAGVLETRGSDAQQQALRRDFLSDVSFPQHAHVLEVGCGTGVLTRVIARLPQAETVIGIDPTPAFLEKARNLSADLRNIAFEVADGRSLPFDEGTFDVVVFDSTLCHIPGPESAIAEAFRVLCANGLLAVFDGDYATTTVALSANDPLQACVDMMLANSVNDRYLVRRLPTMIRAAGFTIASVRSHGFVEAGDGVYMMSIVDRGIDMLRGAGQITEATAGALKAEARARTDAGTFFGHIAYGSVIARKNA